MRVKRDADYDELDERPRRKYQRDASGLRVSVAADQTEVGGPEEPSSESVFRLAWLFVEGWRRKLQKAGDTVERSRWEWELGGASAVSMHSNASSLTLGEILADARKRAHGGQGNHSNYYHYSSMKKQKTRKRQRKSVHWA
ncbi:hypothetical protein CGRA01v4_12354 [Colletotrichum graminicola]|uniref:Uncharacterized protein n=1 Tax=Colletotrichum graminicola (strain M1.001 / M2 / FGSC 10212) TaxID=645133 RepID=E3QSG5_COLGM|nr:uncharacterized protein GLRG_08936 [Colletotrichum graminicola M1.001]EFQ33792.1 hypothetical protein GLRG_08936 [Colletotrichum graminicola M1.001]WDK21065.1 hypothetical protein CGRA01v4_12354 [Colletotrichum graminicola]